MKTYTILTCVLLSLFFSSTLQAQLFQHSKQKGLSNEYTAGLWLNDSVFVLAESVTYNSDLTAALKGFDSEGVELWEIVAPDTTEVMKYQNLVSLTDSTFGVLGFFQQCCDCTSPEPFLEIRKSSDGTLIERIANVLHNVFYSTPFIDTDEKAVSANWGLSTLSTGSTQSRVNYFSFSGDSLFSFDLSGSFQVCSDFEGDMVVASSDELRRYDLLGDVVNSISISGIPSAMESNMNRLAILVNSELILFDSDLNEVSSTELPVVTDYLLNATSTGFVVYGGEFVYRIGNDGSIINTGEFYEISGFEFDEMISNDEMFLLYGSKVSESYTFDNIKHRYSALIAATHEGGTQLWNTDLAITHLSFDNISASSPNFLVLYEADATVTVRNNGTFPVSEFYLNHPNSNGFCFATFGKMFVEETIQPGEEIMIDYPSITGWRFPSSSDSVYILPCVFVTNPNEEIDSNRENDSRCEGQYVFLSLNNPEVSERIKIYPNPTNSEFRIESDLLIRSYQIFDAFGRRIQEGVVNQGSLIEIEDFPNGIYVVKITTDKGIATKKVVVSR